MALTATTTTLLTQRKVDIEAGITRNNTSGHSQAFELFLIEYLLGNIGGASIAGGVTVDNSGIETRLGNTTDPAADTGNGSLNALIKAVRDDVDNLSSLYGSNPTQAASATGDLMQRLRAIAENTQSAGSTALQAVTYDLVGGADIAPLAAKHVVPRDTVGTVLIPTESNGYGGRRYNQRSIFDELSA